MEEKLKVFISQPMRDKTDEEIKLEREHLIKRAKKNYSDDIEIIDSFFEGAPHNANPVWFLGESIKKLAEADVAYFAKDWESARGCKIENTVAVEYGIEVVECYDY